jgi:hypothetical protein
MNFHGLPWRPGIAQVIYAHFQLRVAVHLRFAFPPSYAGLTVADSLSVLAIVGVLSAFGGAKDLPMPRGTERYSTFFAEDHRGSGAFQLRNHLHLP